MHMLMSWPASIVRVYTEQVATASSMLPRSESGTSWFWDVEPGQCHDAYDFDWAEWDEQEEWDDWRDVHEWGGG